MNDIPEPSGFKGFLRDNWIYIVAPFVLIVLALLALLVFGGDSPSGFLYNIF